MLFNETIQYIFSIILPLQLSKYFTCSFDSSCPILEKYIFIDNLYIVLSCLIQISIAFILNLVCFDVIFKGYTDDVTQLLTSFPVDGVCCFLVNLPVFGLVVGMQKPKWI